MDTADINEDSRRRFEAAWAQGAPLRIEDCLPPATSADWLPTLEELVQIELEFRWKAERPKGPQVEEYIARFPQLQMPDVLIRLVTQEYEVRREYGDRPPLAQYEQRFPGLPLPFLAQRETLPNTGQDHAAGQILRAVLAVELELIDDAAFGPVCADWAARPEVHMRSVLAAHGVPTAGCAEIERIAERKLERYAGDARALLSDIAPGRIRDVLHSSPDPSLSGLLSRLPPATGHVLVEALPAGDTSSRYTLSRLHAEGGLGRVWVARDAVLNREVALKELKPQPARHPEAWRRFLKEAQVTGQLEHPNIVPVYELGRRPDDQQPFYTMRFVKGQTLRKAVTEYHASRAKGTEEPLEWLRLLQAFQGVSNAVSYAHSRGVVHRDLKPDNVVLGGFGEVLVLDWGLAKTADSTSDNQPSVDLTKSADLQATAAGNVLGTPAYMAPEQALGQMDQITPRTDVYGLGAILFEVLTGKPPHLPEAGQDIIQRIVLGPTPTAKSLAPHTPLALNAICAKAMAKDPAARYATVADLAQDMQRYLADEPVSVYREPWTVRVGRFVRRHKLGVAVSAAALAVALVSGVIGLFAWQNIQHEQQRLAAERMLKLQATAIADETLATEKLRQNDFATTADILQRTLADLPEEGSLSELRQRIVGKEARARRIADFYRQTDQAEQLEFYEYDDRAEDLIETALRSLGIFEQESWWTHLPTTDLSPVQTEQLREEVYRELLFLGALRAKRGIMSFPNLGPTADHARTLEIVKIAQRYRPSAAGRILEVYAMLGAGQAPTKPDKPAPPPQTATEFYFGGVIMFWFGHMQDDVVTTFFRMAQPWLGVDFSDALNTSDRWLRQAVSLNPRHYWTWFMLGWNKFAVKDYATAELIMSTCVSLRPDHGLGYSYRGLSLLLRAKELKDFGWARFTLTATLAPLPGDWFGHNLGGLRALLSGLDVQVTPRWQEWETRGLADIAQGEQLDPRNPELVWLRGQGLAIAGRWQEANAAFIRAVDREQPLSTWAGRRVEGDKRMYLKYMQLNATGVTRWNDRDADAWTALALAADMVRDTEKARAAAEKALALKPTEHHALAVRAASKAAAQDWAGALADYEAALKAEPKYWNAAFGKANVLDRSGKTDAALVALVDALHLNEHAWQAAAVHLERVKIYTRLNRLDDAHEAWVNARAFDPRAVDPREATKP